MNEERVKKIKKYVITSVIAGIVSVCLLYSAGVFTGALGVSDIMRAFSDAFIVPGVLLILFFCLVFSSTQGMFDSLTYSGKMIARMFVPGAGRQPMEKYGDYIVKKSEKRITGYSFLAFVGLAYVLVGIIFTILFFVL